MRLMLKPSGSTLREERLTNLVSRVGAENVDELATLDLVRIIWSTTLRSSVIQCIVRGEVYVTRSIDSMSSSSRVAGSTSPSSSSLCRGLRERVDVASHRASLGTPTQEPLQRPVAVLAVGRGVLALQDEGVEQVAQP